MQHLTYILIDSLFMIGGLAIAWLSIKNLVSSGALVIAEWQNRHRRGATRIQANRSARSAGDTHASNCHIVTPIPEPQDWQIYDNPTYLRRDILIH